MYSFSMPVFLNLSFFIHEIKRGVIHNSDSIKAGKDDNYIQQKLENEKHELIHQDDLQSHK